MTVTAASATHVGRVRDHNEDAALVTPALFAVADGMGGHQAGEVASAIAVETLERLAQHAQARGRLDPSEVVAQVDEANRAIVGSATSHPERSGMATTLAGLASVTVDGRRLWEVVNVGDSRVYRLAHGQFTQLTQDHSEVASYVRMGLITEEEARRHPARNLVTRCLGREPLDPVDSWIVAPEPHERWLLCSDGLTNELEDPEIAAILGSGPDPQEIADALVSRAVEHGGRDNVTVVVVLATA